LGGDRVTDLVDIVGEGHHVVGRCVRGVAVAAEIDADDAEVLIKRERVPRVAVLVEAVDGDQQGPFAGDVEIKEGVRAVRRIRRERQNCSGERVRGCGRT